MSLKLSLLQDYLIIKKMSPLYELYLKNAPTLR